MVDRLVGCLLALSLQAPPAPPAAPGGAAAAPAGTTAGAAGPAVEPDEQAPPPGSPQELKLWNAGLKANQAVHQTRAAAAMLQVRASGADLLHRLEVAAQASPHEEGERLLALRRRLQAAWDKDRELFTRRWPVDPTRACGYPHLNYDSAMRLAPGPSRQAEVENARVELQRCVDRAKLVTDAMAAANVAFAAAIDDAQKALARAEASARTEDEHERHEASERHEGR